MVLWAPAQSFPFWGELSYLADTCFCTLPPLQLVPPTGP